MSFKLLLVCSLLGFSLVVWIQVPPPPGELKQNWKGMASPLEALQAADNLRTCFDIIEKQSLEAGNTVQNSFYQLLDKVPEGRNLIDKCEKSNSNNQAFVRCIIGDMANLREESLQSLTELQKALSAGSDRMTDIVNQGVDCVSNVMVNV